MKVRNVKDFDELDKNITKKRRKEKFSRGLRNASDWLTEHWGYILIGIEFCGVFTAMARPMARALYSSRKQQRERHMKDIMCYDRSAGHYWTLKRKLKNSEWNKIEKRKANGERMGDILRDLNVLK